MASPETIAVLVDGGFVTKILRKRLGHFPDVTDVEAVIMDAIRRPQLAGAVLYRIFYYDAEPWTQSAANPISKASTDFGATEFAIKSQKLLQRLELRPDIAVRRGNLACHKWKVGRAALQALSKTRRPLSAEDLVPDFEQKGVDMRVGLDMASLAWKRLVSAVVLMSGDSDMVPAMKFARREGLRLYLTTLGSPSVRPELRIHADIVLN